MNNEAVLICVQPAMKYYAWQAEVMLTNFIEVGVDKKHRIHILWAYNTRDAGWEESLDLIKQLETKYNSKGTIYFFYYQDTRVYPINYISGIRPNLLKQHFQIHEYLRNEKIFYHDCDICFTKYPQFLEELDVSGMQWFVSDTISYIGYEYIVSKGNDVMDKMCQIVGCHPYFIKARQNQSGGCQYLFTDIDWTYFHKVEKDCEELFSKITELNNQKKSLNPEYHELQIWCADMWAMLWNAWLRGFTTTIHKDLNFVWATDPITFWDERYIFHNAGVVGEGQFFYKNSYTEKYPYADIEEKMKTISQNAASYRYAELILQTSKNSVYHKKTNLMNNGFAKIKEIVISWAIAANPNEEQKRVAEIRLETCVRCEFVGNSLGIPYCKKCTCPLDFKVFTPVEHGGCPEGFWEV